MYILRFLSNFLSPVLMAAPSIIYCQRNVPRPSIKNSENKSVFHPSAR